MTPFSFSIETLQPVDLSEHLGFCRYIYRQIMRFHQFDHKPILCM